jgi:hypothetical protein
MSSERKIPAYRKWYSMPNQKADVKLEDLDLDGLMMRLI